MRRSHGGPAQRHYDSFITSEPVLTKWYLDCVGEAGEVAIAYWARLQWGPASIAYCSLIVNRDGETRCREHFTAAAEPEYAGDRLEWSAPKLGLRVALDRAAPAYEAELIDGVRWRCLMPSAAARFELDDMPPLSGRGYAELLDLRIAPWKLPIDELRWGRFAGAETSVTWIGWLGGHPLSLVLVDGARVEGASIANDAVVAADLTLTFARDRVLRDEAIGVRLKSVLDVLPIVPRRMLGATETKWLGRAAAARNGVARDRGWAIHEIVRFA